MVVFRSSLKSLIDQSLRGPMSTVISLMRSSLSLLSVKWLLCIQPVNLPNVSSSRFSSSISGWLTPCLTSISIFFCRVYFIAVWYWNVTLDGTSFLSIIVKNVLMVFWWSFRILVSVLSLLHGLCKMSIPRAYEKSTGYFGVQFIPLGTKIRCSLLVTASSSASSLNSSFLVCLNVLWLNTR